MSLVRRCVAEGVGAAAATALFRRLLSPLPENLHSSDQTPAQSSTKVLAGIFIDEKSPLGMNQPVASQNPQFLLNIIHWLPGLLGN